MLRRLIRMVVWLTVFTAAAVAVVKLIGSRRVASPEATVAPWTPPAAPAEAGPVTAVEREAAWAEPVGDACPASYPVKAKMSSGIYHMPGGANYERTRPDRCYASAEAAEADGLRPAKR